MAVSQDFLALFFVNRIDKQAISVGLFSNSYPISKKIIFTMKARRACKDNIDASRTPRSVSLFGANFGFPQIFRKINMWGLLYCSFSEIFFF